MSNRQLIIILILVCALIGFGFLAKQAIAAFMDLSRVSLNAAGIETEASFNMAPARITGISGDVQKGAVKLQWSPLTKTRLNGYRVYRGTSPDVQLIIGASNSNQSFFVDDDVEFGETYYYRVSA
ncbi:MAG: fibronectin type III domain-containing protein, partial [Candidatus Paceibacterota bacterium]